MLGIRLCWGSWLDGDDDGREGFLGLREMTASRGGGERGRLGRSWACWLVERLGRDTEGRSE